MSGQFGARAETAHQEGSRAEDPCLGGDGQGNRGVPITKYQPSSSASQATNPPAKDVVAVQPPVEPDRPDIGAECEQLR